MSKDKSDACQEDQHLKGCIKEKKDVHSQQSLNVTKISDKCFDNDEFSYYSRESLTKMSDGERQVPSVSLKKSVE